jgi:hypothetical protein
VILFSNRTPTGTALAATVVAAALSSLYALFLVFVKFREPIVWIPFAVLAVGAIRVPVKARKA